MFKWLLQITYIKYNVRRLLNDTEKFMQISFHVLIKCNINNNNNIIILQNVCNVCLKWHKIYKQVNKYRKN